MGVADHKVNIVQEKILNEGVSTEGKDVSGVYQSDGAPGHAVKIPRIMMTFFPHELPIVTQKRLAWKTAIQEMLWIWQQKSNDVRWLQERGIKIWDSWAKANNTIGKAYGFQLGKISKRVAASSLLYNMWDNLQIQHIKSTPEKDIVELDQVDYLLYQLQVNNQSNRLLTSLWNWDDLDDMSLPPCVYETQSAVLGNKLHFMVSVRSNDMALGHPFNIFQYGVLHRMLAQVSGYELGELSFDIRMPHIYTRHIPEIQKQMQETVHEAPVLRINPRKTSFYDFTIDDFTLEGYTHGPKRSFDLVVS